MVAMYVMMDTGLMAPVRGWLGRGDRLLVDQGETGVHGLLAMARGYERFMCGDLASARHWAARAVEVGDRYDVVPAATLGRVCGARVRILSGEVDEGVAALEEVAVVLMSGEVDALTTGMVWCELVCAMQGLAQYERAAEWTAAMDTWRRRGDLFGSMNGRCRVHRAELLRLRGDCAEAEEEALQACAELRPWMRREFGWPLTELGTIRLRRGDVEGAEEAFRAAHAGGWDPEPGRALLRLAQGDVETAAALIRQALERPLRIPWKERPPVGGLSRAPLLGPQVQIAIAAGDLPRARVAAGELDEVAARYPSAALRAMAELAGARVAVADGELAAGVGRARAAIEGWCTVGAPYETAGARLVLADALDAMGDPALARLEREAAQASLAGIGAQRLPDAVAVAPAGGLSVEPAPRDVDTAVFHPDGDLRTITFAGVTAVVRDLKGMRHLARLLAEPGREFHALDLVAVEEGTLPVGPRPAAHGDLDLAADDAGPLLDDTARAAYRRRLADVDEDIAEAESMGDGERASLARADRDFLVAELARAYGLGGRARVAGSSAERARVTVTRAIRYALARLAEHHPRVADHLDRTVRTGTYCAYEPDPRAPIAWET